MTTMLCECVETPTLSRIYPFGQWLRQTRRSKGMTQAELAKKAGYSDTYISNLERGFVTSETEKTPRPKPETVDALATAMASNREEQRTFIFEARAKAGFAPPGDVLPAVEEYDTATGEYLTGETSDDLKPASRADIIRLARENAEMRAILEKLLARLSQSDEVSGK